MQNTYLMPREESVATISVAPIHLLVLTKWPPNCLQPGGSNPLFHACSIICWILGMEGIEMFSPEKLPKYKKPLQNQTKIKVFKCCTVQHESAI